MSTGREPRCFDCLNEFTADAPRFATFKKMRDMPPDVDPVEARNLEGMLYDDVIVCEGCAGWYRDAVPLKPEDWA